MVIKTYVNIYVICEYIEMVDLTWLILSFEIICKHMCLYYYVYINYIHYMYELV